ncbi:MAG: histidine phosphatase family protein [Brevundimonas sp.]
MTRVHLIRHAMTDAVGVRLCGRAPGVSLNTQGRAQAERLAARMRARPVAKVLSSPRERALETAGPVAAALKAPVEPSPALDEIDFGEWTGRSFEALEDDPAWIAWNSHRGSAAPPGGEAMAEVQSRLSGLFDGLRADAGEVIAVSHADVIKAAVCAALGLSVDNLHRFDIAPASVTTLRLHADGATLESLNEEAHD